MNNKDIKNRIYNLFDEQVPDEFAEILSKSKIKERNYYMEKDKKSGLDMETCICIYVSCNYRRYICFSKKLFG